MSIQINGTQVISSARQLHNITYLDTTTANTIKGQAGSFVEYDSESFSSSVTVVGVDLDTTKSLHYVEAEFGTVTESYNYNPRAEFTNSSGSYLAMHRRLMTNSTTSTYATTYSTVMELAYWNWGNANNTNFATGERCVLSMWIHSDISTSLPFRSPYVYGQSLCHDNGGNPNITHFAGRFRDTSEIARVGFLATNGQLAYGRATSYTVE